MDAIDRKIIQRLVADGRVSFAALGRLVSLSTPAVHHRVRQLERRGVITGYGARVSPGAIGLGLSGIVAVETEWSIGSRPSHSGFPRSSRRSAAGQRRLIAWGSCSSRGIPARANGSTSGNSSICGRNSRCKCRRKSTARPNTRSVARS